MKSYYIALRVFTFVIPITIHNKKIQSNKKKKNNVKEKQNY